MLFHSLRSVVCAPRRFCAPSFLPLCYLMASLFLCASPAAFAGTWTLTRTSSSSSQTVNGVTSTGSYPPQKGTPGPSITLPAFSPAAPASNVPGITESCSGTLTVTVTGTWNPAGANDPVPNTIVSVQAQATAGGTGQPLSQTSDDGYQDPTGGASSSGTHYKLETSSPFTISLTLKASVSATATANATAMASAVMGSITIAASVPALSVSGTTLDSSGNQGILVGQQATGTISGVPASGSGWTTAYQWNVSGTTFESWSPTTAAVGTAPANPNASSYNAGPIPATNPASWYWNDPGPKPTPETVSCAVTLTPTTGQDPTINLTMNAPQKITVYVPKYTFTATTGYMQINTNAYNQSGALDLYAGPPGGGSGGIVWTATCTTPTTPAFGKGSVELIQIATPNLSYTAYTGSMIPGAQHNDPENGKTGLDGQCPYPSSSYTEGSSNPFTSNDSPTAPLSNSMGSITMTHQFVDYLMYIPPGSTQVVPLATMTWGTNGSANIPTTGNWGDYVTQNGSDSAGTVTATNATTSNTFPSWTLINGPVAIGSF